MTSSRPAPSSVNPAPLAFLLHHAGRRIDEQMAEAADCESLSVVQAKFLRHLVGKPDGVTLAELAELAGCSRGNVTQTLDRLGPAKLTERRENPADARSTLVKLTPAGLQAFRRVEREVMNFERRLVSALGAAKADRLWLALQDVLGSSC